MVTRRYRSPGRDDAAGRTRVALLAAFAEQLGEPGATDVSVPDAATRAGVSVRTVYHHFPDREQRMNGLAAWAAEELDALPPIAGAADLPDHVRRAFARADARLDLARALVTARRAVRHPGAGRRSRQLEIAALLTGVGAPGPPTTRATAVVTMLASPATLVTLADDHGLEVAEAADAAADTVAAVLRDLRSRRRGAEGPA